MKRILSFTILLLSLSVALTSCENVDLGSSQTPKYGKLDIIDRALLPEILRDEWVLKGAGFKKPYIYEKSFSFEDRAEIPLKSIKGNGDNELTFNFTKNIPATFATVQYDEPGGYTEEKHNNQLIHSVANGTKSRACVSMRNNRQLSISSGTPVTMTIA